MKKISLKSLNPLNMVDKVYEGKLNENVKKASDNLYQNLTDREVKISVPYSLEQSLNPKEKDSPAPENSVYFNAVRKLSNELNRKTDAKLGIDKNTNWFKKMRIISKNDPVRLRQKNLVVQLFTSKYETNSKKVSDGIAEKIKGRDLNEVLKDYPSLASVMALNPHIAIAIKSLTTCSTDDDSLQELQDLIHTNIEKNNKDYLNRKLGSATMTSYLAGNFLATSAGVLVAAFLAPVTLGASIAIPIAGAIIGGSVGALSKRVISNKKLISSFNSIIELERAPQILVRDNLNNRAPNNVEVKNADVANINNNENQLPAKDVSQESIDVANINNNENQLPAKDVSQESIVVEKEVAPDIKEQKAQYLDFSSQIANQAKKVNTNQVLRRAEDYDPKYVIPGYKEPLKAN